MLEQKGHSSSFFSVFAGFAVLVIGMLVIFNLAEAVKFVGAGFMFIPQRLGQLPSIGPDDVQVIDLSAPNQTFNITHPGAYFVYYQFPLDLSGKFEAPGLFMTWQGTRRGVPLLPINRGLNPFDTPLAKGRPYLRFEIEQPGVYQLEYALKPGSISIVPDIVTGYEPIMTTAFAIQIGIIVATITAALVWRRRRFKRRMAEVVHHDPKRAEAFWQSQLSKDPTKRQ